MSQEGTPAKLKDILVYEPEEYLSEEEITLIRQTFKYNPQLLRVLRKVFIPSIQDPNLPIEEMSNDVYLTGKNWDQIPAEEAKILMVARQDALKFICGGFISLKQIASMEEESEADRAARLAKDSTK